MKVIHKQQLSVGECTIELPIDAEVLKVNNQKDGIFI